MDELGDSKPLRQQRRVKNLVRMLCGVGPAQGVGTDVEKPEPNYRCFLRKVTSVIVAGLHVARGRRQAILTQVGG